MSGNASHDNESSFEGLMESEICPVSAVSQTPDALEVLEGKTALSALLGTYLPGAELQPPGNRGATVITGGGSDLVTVRDYTGPAANSFFGQRGEQDAAFYYGGILDFTLLNGPSGEGGKSVGASGEDMVPWSAERQEIIMNDNKALASGEVRECSALLDNLVDNLRKRTSAIEKGPDFPGKDVAVTKMKDALDVFTSTSGGRLPEGFMLEISNAGGNATKVADSLQKKLRDMFPKVYYASGDPLTYRFRNFRSQEQLDYASEAATRLQVEAESPVPLSNTVTNPEATMAPLLPTMNQGATARAMAVAGMQAGPIILDGLAGITNYLINIGLLKNQARVAADDLIKTQILSQLKGNPDSGFLIQVSEVGTTHPENVTIWEVTGAIAFKAGSALEAWEQVQRTSFWEASPEYNQAKYRSYYWFQNGEVSRFQPSQGLTYKERRPTP